MSELDSTTIQAKTRDGQFDKSRAELFDLMNVLRFLAAVAVMFSHTRSVLLSDYQADMSMAVTVIYAAAGLGHQAVIIFFVLSGFWITKVVVERHTKTDFWRDYTVSRLSRLMIVLVPALLLGGLLDYIGSENMRAPLYFGTTGTTAIETPIYLDVITLLGNLAFLQTLAVPSFGSNGPLWSLSYEFWFYMWFPALWLFLIRRRPNIMLLSLSIGLLYPKVALGFLSWLMGTALYFALDRFPVRRTSASIILACGLAWTALGLVAARVGFGLIADPFLAAGFAVALFGFAQSQIRLSGRLSIFARYGGTSSYSLYAVHFPVLALLVSIITPVRLQPTAPNLLLLLAITAVLVLVGWLFSLLTERHTGRVKAALMQELRPSEIGRS